MPEVSSLPNPKTFVLFNGQYPKDVKQALLQSAAGLGYRVIPADIGPFKSGERFCEPKTKKHRLFLQNQEDLVGANVHVVMSMTADSNKFLVDTINTAATLKKYGVRNIHMILPFAPFARQDRPFEGRMCSVMGETYPKHLKFAGVDKITTFDMHSKAAEGHYIDAFGTENVHFVSAIGEITKAAKELVGDEAPRYKITAPDGADKPHDVAQIKARDMGGLWHGDAYQGRIAEPCGIVKGHTGANATKVLKFIGDVKEFNVFCIDDLTDTGGTHLNAAQTFKENGAGKRMSAVTHAFLSGNSLSVLTSETVKGNPNPIDHFFATDSILGVYGKAKRLTEDQRKRFTIVPVTPLITQALEWTF